MPIDDADGNSASTPGGRSNGHNRPFADAPTETIHRPLRRTDAHTEMDGEATVRGALQPPGGARPASLTVIRPLAQDLTITRPRPSRIRPKSAPRISYLAAGLSRSTCDTDGTMTY